MKNNMADFDYDKIKDMEALMEMHHIIRHM